MKGVEITVPLFHHLDEASKVILDAFREEAITSAFLDLSREGTRKSYFHVIRFVAGLYHEAGHPLLIALNAGRIIGAAILKSPRVSISRGRLFRKALPVLPRLLGLVRYSFRAARLSRLLIPPGNLPENYYTLDMLAVHPSQQGRGVGGLLLKHIAGLCAMDKAASGIYLLAGDEKNCSFYERFGYKLWEARPAGSTIAYHMFMPKS